MSTTIPHFESLCQRFPTWTEMKSHLESAEGGSLRVIGTGEPATNPFAVIRTVKGKSSTTAETQFLRSVVWNTVTNRPVCVAPPKAKEGLPPVGVQLASTEDFLDGFMMNAFVATGSSGDSPVLHLATRTQLGGSNSFYNADKSFGDMFREALATTPLKDEAGLLAALSASPLSFVSFVVSHPQHRVVAKPAAASLAVVHMGHVTETGLVQLAERPTQWPQSLARLQVPSYPLRLFHSEQEINDLLRKTAVQRGWRWQGLVFKDGVGGRWRLRTPTYSLLRELRGSESTPVERFLRLRSTGKVTDYLKHYREEAQDFWDFEQTLRARTADVLAAYCDVHKAHAATFKELPDAYKPAVYQLHLEWLSSLRPKGYKVRLQNAIAVINTMRSFEQRRLIDAEPYVAKAPATAWAAVAGGNDSSTVPAVQQQVGAQQQQLVQE